MVFLEQWYEVILIAHLLLTFSLAGASVHHFLRILGSYCNGHACCHVRFSAIFSAFIGKRKALALYSRNRPD